MLCLPVIARVKLLYTLHHIQYSSTPSSSTTERTQLTQSLSSIDLLYPKTHSYQPFKRVSVSRGRTGSSHHSWALVPATRLPHCGFRRAPFRLDLYRDVLYFLLILELQGVCATDIPCTCFLLSEHVCSARVCIQVRCAYTDVR